MTNKIKKNNTDRGNEYNLEEKRYLAKKKKI